MTVREPKYSRKKKKSGKSGHLEICRETEARHNTPPEVSDRSAPIVRRRRRRVGCTQEGQADAAVSRWVVLVGEDVRAQVLAREGGKVWGKGGRGRGGRVQVWEGEVEGRGCSQGWFQEGVQGEVPGRREEVQGRLREGRGRRARLFRVYLADPAGQGRIRINISIPSNELPIFSFFFSLHLFFFPHFFI